MNHRIEFQQFTKELNSLKSNPMHSSKNYNLNIKSIENNAITFAKQMSYDRTQNSTIPLNLVEICRGLMQSIEMYKKKHKLVFDTELREDYTTTIDKIIKTLDKMMILTMNNSNAWEDTKKELNMMHIRLHGIMHRMVQYKIYHDILKQTNLGNNVIGEIFPYLY